MGKYIWVTLAGGVAGLVVFLAVVLANPGEGGSVASRVGVAVLAVVLGGAIFFLRYYIRDRGQRAGEKMRD